MSRFREISFEVTFIVSTLDEVGENEAYKSVSEFMESAVKEMAQCPQIAVSRPFVVIKAAADSSPVCQ